MEPPVTGVTIWGMCVKPTSHSPEGSVSPGCRTWADVSDAGAGTLLPGAAPWTAPEVEMRYFLWLRRTTGLTSHERLSLALLV